MTTALTGTPGAFPLTNTCTVPEPGDAVRAEDVQIVAQTLLNQDEALQARIRYLKYQPVNVVVGSGDDNDGAATSFATFSTASYTDGLTLDVPSAVSTDVIIARAVMLCQSDVGVLARLRIQAITGHGGGSPSAQSNLAGAVASVDGATATTDWFQVVLQGRVVADRTGTVRLIVVGKTLADTLTIRCYHITAEHYRVNP